jgi:hypothetical protein
MKLRDFLEQWGFSTLKINVGFLTAEFEPKAPDRAAAWDLYVELLTRVTTQYLEPADGDEKTALDSIHALFPLTRDSLKRHGSGAGQFAKIAIPVLNQIIRPFTARWHRKSLAGAFAAAAGCEEFRAELAKLQDQLRRYTGALAAMAAVEDLTALEIHGTK